MTADVELWFVDVDAADEDEPIFSLVAPCSPRVGAKVEVGSDNDPPVTYEVVRVEEAWPVWLHGGSKASLGQRTGTVWVREARP